MYHQDIFTETENENIDVKILTDDISKKTKITGDSLNNFTGKIELVTDDT